MCICVYVSMLEKRNNKLVDLSPCSEKTPLGVIGMVVGKRRPLEICHTKNLNFKNKENIKQKIHSLKQNTHLKNKERKKLASFPLFLSPEL